MRRLICLLLGGLALGCDVASGLDGFYVRDVTEPEIIPCDDVPADDFSGGLDATRWIVGGAAEIAADDGLVITAAPDQVGSIESVATFDFTGCQAHVELAAPPGSEGQASFLLSLPAGYVGFVTATDGTTRMGLSVEPNLVGESTLVNAFEPTWWRLRDAGEDLVFETSPDGVTWAVKRRIAAPELAGATMILSGAARATAPDDVVTIFDHLNAEP